MSESYFNAFFFSFVGFMEITGRSRQLYDGNCAPVERVRSDFKPLLAGAIVLHLVYNLCSLARNCFSHCMSLLGE